MYNFCWTFATFFGKTRSTVVFENLWKFIQISSETRRWFQCSTSPDPESEIPFVKWFGKSSCMDQLIKQIGHDYTRRICFGIFWEKCTRGPGQMVSGGESKLSGLEAFHKRRKWPGVWQSPFGQIIQTKSSLLLLCVSVLSFLKWNLEMASTAWKVTSSSIVNV